MRGFWYLMFNSLYSMGTIGVIIISLVAAVCLAGISIFIWYYRYRFISFIKHEHTPDMDSHSPEGYTDKPFYYRGDTITFFLRSDAERNILSLRKMNGPFEYQELYTAPFGRIEQSTPSNASEAGCSWKPSQTLLIGEEFKAGYYQALVTSEGSSTPFEIYFIIGEKKAASIVIVAPVSTWTAYNPWGGKSLYQNKFENKTVYFVSTQRPNTAFEINHDIQVEANTFNWFSATYPGVSIIPDYALEEASPAMPGTLEQCELLVLSYHCEYLSKEMHRAVRAAVARGISLISMGANQLFWVVRWHSQHTRMECRKDMTFFQNTLTYGGLWKHHFRPQQKHVGGCYNCLGMHTYAPYRLLAKSDHWILEGLTIQTGDLFGMRGIQGRPICGAETDKTGRRLGNFEIIARGMNCESEAMGTTYDANDPHWNGSGGGEMTVGYRANGAAVLNTASIESGAGLGVDPVFTGIIENFMKRFGPKLLRSRTAEIPKVQRRDLSLDSVPNNL